MSFNLNFTNHIVADFLRAVIDIALMESIDMVVDLIHIVENFHMSTEDKPMIIDHQMLTVALKDIKMGINLE
jgi:hypothetical protein